MEVTAEVIAQHFNGEIVGDPNVKVSSVAKIENGKPGNICFLANPKYEQYLYTCKASIIIINRSFQPKEPVQPTLILVDNAYEAVASLLDLLNTLKKSKKSGKSWRAKCAWSAKLGKGVYVGEFSFVGKKSKIGNNCILHANVVIGSDGFGFAPREDGSYKKIPQTGIVTIEDDVEIGANTVVDRATMGTTLIKKGVKLDNLIQVAHNVEIGEHTVMAAQTGVAGSSKVGAKCIIGGQVGIAGHITIHDKTSVGAQAGILGNTKKEGETLMGSPAFDYKQYLKCYALFRKLPNK